MSTPSDDPVESLVSRWFALHAQGQLSSPEQLCRDCPELLPEFQRRLGMLDKFDCFLGKLSTEQEPLPPAPSPVSAKPETISPSAARPLDDPFATVPASPVECAPPTSSVPPGYEILGELGRGGMGVVYKARQVQLNRLVALKMILSGGHAGSEERVRFLAEGEAIAAIRHPGIVQIYDFGTHGGLPYFALEFCAGDSLAGKLNGTPLPPREAARIVEQVADAIQAAHQRGIIHRDLKPANVLLSFSRDAESSERSARGDALRSEDSASRLNAVEPKVSDFGLARRVEGGIGLTQTGAVMGTPSYMAPEQAEAKKDIGPAADVYALGAILYECLTGRPPFKAATAFDTIMQVVATEPVPVRQLQPGVPVDLETICLKCLQKEPGKRYGSAREMAEDLKHYQQGRPIAARPVGRLERLLRWCSREPIVAGLLAAVLLVLTIGVVVSSVLGMKAARSASLAENERERADKKAREATENEQRANRGEERATEQLNRAERLVYAGKLTKAQLMWRDDKVPEALDLLDECQWNLRGWEHRHLWSLYNSNQVTFGGHTGPVYSVAWSPDGKRIVSGSGDHTLKVWDAEKGQEVLSPKGHTSPVMSVAWSPDGKRIVSGSQDNTLKVWDAEKGQHVLSLKGHASPVMSVAWSPDGKRIVSVSQDRTLKVWDAEKGQEILSLKGHTDGVTSVAWSPDGKRIVSGSGDNTLKVWDVEKGQEILSLKGHTGGVNGVAWSPDTKRIVSGGGDGTLKAWDAEKGQEVLSIEGHANEVYSVAWSLDGKRILSGSGDGTLKVWDAEKGSMSSPSRATPAS